jgi:hypothetical protein
MGKITERHTPRWFEPILAIALTWLIAATALDLLDRVGRAAKKAL